MSDTQRFKIVLPILKTRVEVRKDEKGNEREVRFVEGVASSTDKDLHGDKMAPSAIKSMAESLKFHEVPLNADHDTTWSAEIGPIVKLEVTEDNDLVLEAELSEMSKANDLWYALTKQNKKLGLSIGGYVKEYEMVKEDETDDDGKETGESHWYRLYKDIDLDHVAVTSSPANPKTWVSAISKSIDPARDLELIKATAEKKTSDTTDKKRSATDIRNLAHKIARKVQDIEANLLLELTESFLFKLNASQIEKVEKYLDLLERNMSMDKKDVSLEAEEAKKLAEALDTPDVAKDENSAALENESSDDTNPDEGSEPTPPVKPEGEPSEPEEGEDESQEEVGEETPTDPIANSADDEASNDKGEGEESEESDESSETEESDEEKSDEDEADEDKASEEESTEKSNPSELAEVIKGLTENLKLVVKSNEELAARVAELEGQPSTRKTIEVSKEIGDDDSEEVDAKELKKAMDKEIAETREKYASDPRLFSMIQRIRSEYALKAKGLK